MKLLMYGAGSVGRGFVGPLFAKAGYEIAFADVDRRIVEALNRRRGYSYTVAAEPPYDVPVTGVRGVDGADKRAVLREIASCDLMAVSIGAAALQKAAPLIALGFSLRMKENGRPLNLLICENLKDSSRLLRGWIESELPEGDRPLSRERLGLVGTAIGRMIPPAASGAEDPLRVTAEEYGFLPADKDAFVGEPPEAEGLVLCAPFSFYEERKLYLHNMGHAVSAFLGMLYGYKTIPEAVADPVVRLLVQSAMTESAAALSAKFSVPFAGVFDHAEDLLLRFGNAALGDTCERVGRDPLRKLQAGDRLAGALELCRGGGVHPIYIALGYAAALHQVTGDAGRAAEIAATAGGLAEDHAELVMKLFAALAQPPGGLLRAAERLKREMRGNIV